MNRNNIAARMGRWSATHWKTATFGWLAFVVVSFGIGGMVGMKTHRRRRPWAGRVGPHGQDPRRRISAAGRREHPRPELDPPDDRPGVPGRRPRRRRGDLEARRRPARPLAPRSREQRADRPERARGPRRAPDPRRPRHGGRPDRPRPRPCGRAAAGAPAALHRAVRRREQDRRARQPPTGTTSARPGCCRSRSRWSSSWSPSARSWQPGSRCCSR